MTQTSTGDYGVFTNRWSHTRNWLLSQMPEDCRVPPEQYVASRLARMEHWAALEEHLAWMQRHERAHAGKSAC